MCISIFQCFQTIFSLAMRSSGSIGDMLLKPSVRDLPLYIFRYAFDMVVFIVINIVFINIIFGVIIDTFKVLKNKNERIKRELNNICFVCNLKRDQFENRQLDFDGHVALTHYLWSYIYFMLYLHKKERHKKTSVEVQIDEMIRHKRNQWIPYLLTKRLRPSDLDS